MVHRPSLIRYRIVLVYACANFRAVPVSVRSTSSPVVVNCGLGSLSSSLISPSGAPTWLCVHLGAADSLEGTEVATDGPGLTSVHGMPVCRAVSELAGECSAASRSMLLPLTVTVLYRAGRNQQPLAL